MPTIENTVVRAADTWLPLDVDELDFVAFDYADMLAAGESVASAAITCEVVDGTDTSPASRLSGSPQINGTEVRQAVVSPLRDVTYLIRCKATLTPGPRVLTIAGRLSVLKVGAA